MKSYTITVNGNVYDVTVEETGASQAAPTAAPAPAPRAAAPAPAAAPKASGAAGSIKIEAGAAGKGIQAGICSRQTGEKGRSDSCTGDYEDGDAGCRTAGRHSSKHRSSCWRYGRIRRVTGYHELVNRSY